MRSALFLALVIAIPAGLAGCIGGEETVEPAATNQSPEPNQTGPRIRNATTSANAGHGNASDEATADANGTLGGSNGSEATLEPVRFSAPVRVGDEREHFEPSVEVGEDGTVYVTAPTAAIYTNGGRYASDVWYARPGGNFSRMPSPGQVHERQPGFEGSIALDDAGRLYFVDLLLVDNTFTRWNVGSGEPSWEMSRPLQGTLSPADDRPWVAAHGDGIVYYLGNDVSPVPAPSNAQQGSTTVSGIWFHASTDAGLTWGPGYKFPDSRWCSLAPSKADTRTVHVACLTYNDVSSGTHSVHVYGSEDRGQGWNRTLLTEDKAVSPQEVGYPAAATDATGRPFVAWADDDVEDEQPGRLRVATPAGNGSWRTQALVPFEGTVENPWLSASGDGRVALTFHGSPEVEASADRPWYPYLLLTDDATASAPTWTLVQLSEEPVGEGAIPPQDFFQNDLGPDGRVHAVYHDETGGTTKVLYRQQVTGPAIGTAATS